MAKKLTNQNKDVDPEVLSILDETPPDINEPIVPDPENDDTIPEDEILPDPDNEEPEVIPEPDPELTPESEETLEDKDKKYRSQQTETQIQRAKNQALIDKVDEAAKVGEPTEDELKKFVAQDGIDWNELTNFEQAQAKRSYIAEKRFDLVNQAVQGQKQIDEWAVKIDEFIDSTDAKPEFIELSSHEADFRSFCMKASHRGTPIDILLAAFLHNLPPTEKKRGTLLERGGGGDKVERPTGIVDADMAAKLRRDNPREYARQVRAGKIKIEI